MNLNCLTAGSQPRSWVMPKCSSCYTNWNYGQNNKWWGLCQDFRTSKYILKNATCWIKGYISSLTRMQELNWSYWIVYRKLVNYYNRKPIRLLPNLTICDFITFPCTGNLLLSKTWDHGIGDFIIGSSKLIFPLQQHWWQFPLICNI